MEKIKITRLEMGEAHVLCNDCFARLYSFDGNEDVLRPCPYVKDEKGKCTDVLKNNTLINTVVQLLTDDPFIKIDLGDSTNTFETQFDIDTTDCDLAHEISLWGLEQHNKLFERGFCYSEIKDIQIRNKKFIIYHKRISSNEIKSAKANAIAVGLLGKSYITVNLGDGNAPDVYDYGFTFDEYPETQLIINQICNFAATLYDGGNIVSIEIKNIEVTNYTVVIKYKCNYK